MNMAKKMPVPVCGLALGLATLGNLLSPYGNAIRYLCGAGSFFIILLFSINILSNWKMFLKEIENPVAFSVLPTYTMSIMLLATYVKPFIGVIAFYIWIVALILQFFIIIMFIKSFVLKFNIKTVFTSWLVVAVGFVMGSITSPAMGMKTLGQAIFYLGIVSYPIMLSIVLYRVFKVKQIPEPALPTLAIFAAPASLCLSGYLSVFEQKNVTFVIIMALICLINYVCVLLVILLKLIRLKFYPSFSSFGFPLVISAVALKMSNEFFMNMGIIFLNFLQPITLFFSVASIIFVLYKYIIFWLIKDKNNTSISD